MNPTFPDPDVKVNMSLDEIIRLSQQQSEDQTQGKGGRGVRKNFHRNARRLNSLDSREHSVPLLPSSQGVRIYVSKNSPLLSFENKRRIAEIFSSRALNAELLEKSKKIIPAEYKLIRTKSGIERVLVPVPDFLARPAKRMRPLRRMVKLPHRTPSPQRPLSQPPPLNTKPIYKPPSPSPTHQPPQHTTPMDIDDTKDDILLFNPPPCQKPFEVIDVESNLPVDVVEAKKMFLGGSLTEQTGTKTLNDRFTRLTGNFYF